MVQTELTFINHTALPILIYFSIVGVEVLPTGQVRYRGYETCPSGKKRWNDSIKQEPIFKIKPTPISKHNLTYQQPSLPHTTLPVTTSPPEEGVRRCIGLVQALEQVPDQDLMNGIVAEPTLFRNQTSRLVAKAFDALSQRVVGARPTTSEFDTNVHM